MPSSDAAPPGEGGSHINWKLVQQVVRDLTGADALSASMPGGRRRESFRIETTKGPLIATCRSAAARGAVEAQVLERLDPLTGLTPRFLGYRQGVLLQSDLGNHRLSMALLGQGEADCREGVRRAFVALAEIQTAANRGAALPGVFLAPSAIGGLVASVPDMAAAQGLPRPPVETGEVVEMLTVPPLGFVKWDARAGNAMVSDDARVCWFDFEWAGWRSGLEDFAWGFADENWPLGAEATLEIALKICRETPHLNTALDRLGPGVILALGVVLTARRVLRLRGVKAKPLPEDTARRMDLPDGRPEAIARLCQNGRFLAGQAAPLKGYAALFDAVLEV